MAIGVGALALILVLRRVSPRIPGFLVAIVVTSVAAVAFGLHVATIPVSSSALLAPTW